MNEPVAQKIFRAISRRLPQSIICALDTMNPGCMMRLCCGIQTTLPDDTFIVSYPRSGNTWTRYILAYLMAGVTKPLNSVQVNDFAPDVYHSINQINVATSKRWIKSHEPLLDLYPRVIYIHRDPREALVSYWHFSRRLGTFSGTFGDFLRSRVPNHHGSWKTHIQAMHRKLKDDPLNIHVVRYDQLQNDFHNAVSQLIQWSGVGNPVDIDAVSKLTSMENMVSSEQTCESVFRIKSGESFFVDRGKSSDWRNTWTTSDLDWWAKDREVIKLMEQHGYL